MALQPGKDRAAVTQLRKQLGALDVFAGAAGAMISSGLFILPAMAYAKAGPAVIVSDAGWTPDNMHPHGAGHHKWP